MIRRHDSPPAPPRTRGRAFGAAQRPAVSNTVAAYERLFRAMHGLSPDGIRRLGAEAGDTIGARRPEAFEEILGIAEGAGADPLSLLAINARTEIFAGGGHRDGGSRECSVLGVAGARSASGPILAQNWDWHPDAGPSLVLWTVHDDAGAWFTTLTEAGILGKIGLNSRGLGVCLSILGSSDDGGGFPGLPIHLVLRAILEDCADVDQARRLVAGERYAASTAITVADAGGALSTVEVSPGGVTVLEERDDVIGHTNHFLGGTHGAVDTVARVSLGTGRRLDEVRGALASPAPLSAEAIKAVLRSHCAAPTSICNHELHHPDYADRQQTMASVLLHVRDRALEVSDGPPCEAPYETLGPPPAADSSPGLGVGAEAG